MSNTPNPKNAVIIGAGIGGLATAIQLANKGVEVDVYEARNQPGGRASRISSPRGHAFDTGPTLLLMIEPLRELFEVTGAKLDDYLELKLLDPSYRVHYADGTIFDSWVNLPKMLKEIKEKIGEEEAENYFSFFTYLASLYRETVPRFVTKNFNRLGDFISPKNLLILTKYRMLEKLYHRVSRHFKDDRLRMLFSFQAMYLGISPFDAPSVYSVVTYMESGEGIWFPMGGLHAVPRALEKRAKELGVRFHYDTPVEEILVENGRTAGVRVNGKEVAAATVIANADLPHAYRNLLPASARSHWTDESLNKLEYSSSTYMLYLGVKRQHQALHHHNVFFGEGYKAALDEIFKEKRVPKPEDLAFYVCVPNRTDATLAPDGEDSVYVLVPVPHKGGEVDWQTEGPKIRSEVFRRLKDKGIDLEPDIVWEKDFTPNDWEAEYRLDRGAAFGLSHGFFQSAYFRPKNKSEDVEALYFAGASTTPGNGIPMVIISGKLAAERVLEDMPELTQSETVKGGDEVISGAQQHKEIVAA